MEGLLFVCWRLFVIVVEPDRLLGIWLEWAFCHEVRTWSTGFHILLDVSDECICIFYGGTSFIG